MIARRRAAQGSAFGVMFAREVMRVLGRRKMLRARPANKKASR